MQRDQALLGVRSERSEVQAFEALEPPRIRASELRQRGGKEAALWAGGCLGFVDDDATSHHKVV